MLFLAGSPVSIHAPLARSNLTSISARSSVPFQYMLLLRGATQIRDTPAAWDGFNTCSSCEEQREPTVDERLFVWFQYMLLLRGATETPRPEQIIAGFNTCSSCEEQLGVHAHICALKTVSIHAPLARSNRRGSKLEKKSDVSIHAPLARSNAEHNGKDSH